MILYFILCNNLWHLQLVGRFDFFSKLTREFFIVNFGVKHLGRSFENCGFRVLLVYQRGYHKFCLAMPKTTVGRPFGFKILSLSELVVLVGSRIWPFFNAIIL